MKSSFQIIKRKYRTVALLNAAMTGLAAALATVGVILLSLTLARVPFGWFYYIVIGAGVFLAAGGISIVFFLPGEKAVARSLDEEYSLGERVQTMVAFRDREGDIYDHQRWDTDMRLGAIAGKRISFRKVWAPFLAVMLAVVMMAVGMVSGIFLTEAETDDPGSAEFVYSIMKQNALLELISNVEDSNLDEQTAEAVKDELNKLHNYLLENQVTVRDMKGAVVVAVSGTDDALENATSYRSVHPVALSANTDLSDIIVYALGAHKQYTDQLKSYNNLKRYYEDGLIRGDEIAQFTQERFSVIRTELLMLPDESGMPQEITYEEFRSNISDYAAKINAKFEPVKATMEEQEKTPSALFDAYYTFGSALAAYAETIDGSTDLQGMRASADSCLNVFSNSFMTAMLNESYPCMMEHFIRKKLCSIFGMTERELPPITPDPKLSTGGSEAGGGENEHGGSGGGGGSGDVLAGSDDVIYDPDVADYVQYVSVLEDRYARVFELIQSPDTPEETRKAILAYFEYLFSIGELN